MYARPTILLVDDNPHIRSFIKPALEDSGFNCIEAANGEEAVYQVEESHPDLIVLDIELGDPDLDGLDVCKRIRSLGFNMPVIFLTVRATVEDLKRGFQVAGPGADYVRKLEELRRLQIEGQLAVKGSDTDELIARIRARLPADIQHLGPDLSDNTKTKKCGAPHCRSVGGGPSNAVRIRNLQDAGRRGRRRGRDGGAPRSRVPEWFPGRETVVGIRSRQR